MLTALTTPFFVGFGSGSVLVGGIGDMFYGISMVPLFKTPSISHVSRENMQITPLTCEVKKIPWWMQISI